MNIKKYLSKAQPPQTHLFVNPHRGKKPLVSYSNLQTSTYSHTAHFTKPRENTNSVKYPDRKLPFKYRSNIKQQITFCSSKTTETKKNKIKIKIKVCKNITTKFRKSVQSNSFSIKRPHRVDKHCSVELLL